MKTMSRRKVKFQRSQNGILRRFR